MTWGQGFVLTAHSGPIITDDSAEYNDIIRCLNLSRATLQSARTLLCSYELSVADRQKLQAAISLLCSVIHFLQDRRRVGAGLLAAPESVAIAEPAASVAITGQANAEIAGTMSRRLLIIELGLV